MSSQLKRFLETFRPRGRSAKYESLEELPGKGEAGSDLEEELSSEILRCSPIDANIRSTLARLKLAITVLASLLLFVCVAWAGREFKTERIPVTYYDIYCKNSLIYYDLFLRRSTLRQV